MWEWRRKMPKTETNNYGASARWIKIVTQHLRARLISNILFHLAFWQHLLQPLKADRASHYGNLRARPGKKTLVQFVKHIKARSRSGSLHYPRSRRSGLLPSASASLQPRHKLLDRLVLQVRAHVAGVGAVCVPSKQAPAETQTTFIRLRCRIRQHMISSISAVKVRLVFPQVK